jgi:hypothetical protein
MKPDDLEDLAYQGQEMPKGLDGADQLLFLSFRRLYAYAKLTKMPQDQGKREKRELLREYQRWKAEIQRVEKTQRMWQDIERAANRFGVEQTVENARAFHRAVYGVGLLPEGGRGNGG